MKQKILRAGRAESFAPLLTGNVSTDVLKAGSTCRALLKTKGNDFGDYCRLTFDCSR